MDEVREDTPPEENQESKSHEEAPDEGAFLLEKEIEVQMRIASAFLEIESMKEEM